MLHSASLQQLTIHSLLFNVDRNYCSCTRNDAVAFEFENCTGLKRTREKKVVRRVECPLRSCNYANALMSLVTRVSRIVDLSFFFSMKTAANKILKFAWLRKEYVNYAKFLRARCTFTFQSLRSLVPRSLPDSVVTSRDVAVPSVFRIHRSYVLFSDPRFCAR